MSSFLVLAEKVATSHLSLHEACLTAFYQSCRRDGVFTVVQRVAGFDLEIACYEKGSERILEGKELAEVLEMELV